MSNLKVLHILSSPAAGGAEVFVKDLLINSKKVDIQAGVLFISSATDIGRSADFEKMFLATLSKNHIPYFILPTSARRNIFKGYAYFKSCIKKFHPDCIHSHLLSGLIYSKLFAWNCPLIYTHHSSVIETNIVIFKLVMRLCDGHIGISLACSEFLNNYLPKEKICKTIYNAIDEDRIVSQQKTESVRTGHINLLAVGRISKEKNYSLLLASLNIVKQRVGNIFKLKIAGEGDLKLLSVLKTYVVENNLTDNVQFLGNRSDIAEIMHNADIFVMSSNYEGLPIALLEAQISGLASIVTDVGGCKEVIDITKGGIVIPPNSLNELAEQIIGLIETPNRRQELSKKATNNIGVFSISECLLKHKHFYQSQM